MKRTVVTVLLAWVCLGSAAARAEQTAPRDLWPQAALAADNGDIDTALKKTAELVDAGKALGIRTFPLYASAAASFGRQAAKQNNQPGVQWASKAADQLDPFSPLVAFTRSDGAAGLRDWAGAVRHALLGIGNVFLGYRLRLLSRSDVVVVLLLALLLTASIFALALFVRYGRAMAHDFREIVGARLHGGAVTVLAFALLFLPIFLWLGPVWLVFYWFIIFFAYANPMERIVIVTLALLLAAAPIVLDLSSHWIAGVDSPVVMAAIAGQERSYQPDALRRLSELVNIVPDDATLQVLLGNLYLQDGNERQATEHYRRAVELKDNAGAHVNLGNLHFFNNDFAAAITEYGKAEQLDPKLAIAFYNHSVASGETYKFDDQAKMLDQAKRIDRSGIEKISSNPPAQKVAMYRPPISLAWKVESEIARRGVARTLFGNYSWFDPVVSAKNPITAGALLTALLAPMVWLKRRRAGFAGQCIKCGRTYCHRCKSSRESATYCTQCIHIYLKRDGVSLDTKRAKVEEVAEHLGGIVRRNKILASFLPGSAQLIEGRTAKGLLGVFLFVLSVSLAVLVGRLAPVLVGDMAKMLVRSLAILAAVILWFALTLPVYRRRAATA
jgi:tetratricopeptide (TPR) repeat protein